ncbi:COG0325 Predicted enzyme with a TIM-barrel fold [Candidatus Nanopelagicaceae bacterium]
MNRREFLRKNLQRVQEKIAPYSATLIVVTKTYPVSDVQILSELGVTDFGENRNEEGLEKSAIVPATWHFQGGIQGRKIKEIVQWADVIHSLDDAGHCEKIQTLATRPIDIFLQLSLDQDPSRGGVGEPALAELAEKVLHSGNPHLTLKGLMCVPPVELDPREAFTEIAQIHQRFMGQFPEAKYLSAGMSGDFEIALDCGATHIRVGSSILGSRTPAQ